MIEPPHADPRTASPQARVLVVGDAMLDRYWFGAVDRISPEAPVPVVRVNRARRSALGGAANVACNVQTLGAQASLLTVVGDDEPAHRLEALLSETGIATLLKRDPRLTTTVKLRVIGRSQQLLRMDFENEPDHEVLAEHARRLTRSALPQHDAVLFSDYGKGGLTHIPAMIAARARRRQAGAGRPEGQRLQPLPRRRPSSRPTAPSCAQVVGALERARRSCASAGAGAARRARPRARCC